MLTNTCAAKLQKTDSWTHVTHLNLTGPAYLVIYRKISQNWSRKHLMKHISQDSPVRPVGSLSSNLWWWSVQFSSAVQLCLTLWDPMNHSTPGLLVHQKLPEFTQTHVHWVGDVVQPSHSLSSPSPPTSIFPIIRVFSNKSALRIRWPKCWSFSFNISPSNEHAGLISFRMDWLDLLEIQGTLKILLQHHSSKASIL